MSQAIVTESKLVAIADAIRSQTGGTSSLTLDQMASEIANISGGGGGGSADYGAFAMGTLSEIDLGTATFVRSSAFVNLSSLSSVKGLNVLSVSASAFYSCTNLAIVNMPNIKTLGVYAFASCSTLSSFSFASLTSIGERAFENCGFVSANYPLSFFGSNMFTSNQKLAYFYASNVSTITNHPFGFCGRSVASGCDFYFPNVTSINSTIAQFNGTSFLSTKSLSDVFPNLEYVGSATFISSMLPRDIGLPLCNYIGSSAFRASTINYGWATVSRGAFPKTSYIGITAFRNQRYLSILDLTGVSSVPALASMDVFISTPMSNSTYLGHFGSIYVPSSLYTAFTTATNWVTYSARITSDPVPA